MTERPEPAIRSYFFGKGYRDLGETIKESWQRNLATARSHFEKGAAMADGEASQKIASVLFFTAGASVILFGTTFFLAVSAFHVTVLLGFFLMIYLAFSLVYLSEQGYLALRKYFTVCPECHTGHLPEYFCPGCNVGHRKLVPSSYGVLYHTCTCGTKLPAAFFLGRSALTCRCQECGHLLERVHTESRKAFIPVFGGPSVGKTAFLYSGVIQYRHRCTAEGLVPSFVDSTTEKEFERVTSQLARGQVPDKTLSTLPRAMNIQITDGRQAPRLFYLYDPAGEAFQQTDDLVLHKYQAYLSGLVFLIDPFAIAEVRQEYGASLPAVQNQVKPSSLEAEDSFSRILISMEEHFGLERGRKLSRPLAVVINKVDAFDLEEKIGETAVRKALGAAGKSPDVASVRNELIKRQLCAWKQSNFVQLLDTRCAKLRYFTCSSLGRMPDASSRPFVGTRVLEPILWILAEGAKGFDLLETKR